jgi:hypothetical protein
MQNQQPHDYPIEHFSQMGEFAVALKAVPAQILRHEYFYEGFGSWVTIVRIHGKKYQFTYDGRDRTYTLEAYSDPPLSSNNRVLWQHSAADSKIVPIADMIVALQAT